MISVQSASPSCNVEVRASQEEQAEVKNCGPDPFDFGSESPEDIWKQILKNEFEGTVPEEIPSGSDFEHRTKAELLRKMPGIETRVPVLCLASIPFASALRGGPGACMCDPAIEYHQEFNDFNHEAHDFLDPSSGVEVCFNHYNIGDKCLPRLLTGSGRRKSFKELETGQEVNDLLFRGTWWYRGFWKGSRYDHTVMLILATATGATPKMKIKELLERPCTEVGLSLLKNAIASCDGVLSSLFLFNAQRRRDGLPKRSNEYYDRVTRTMIRGFITDLFMTDVDQLTYYEKVKDARQMIGECGIKEKGFEPLPDELWFFRDCIAELKCIPEDRFTLRRIAILQEKRATGMPNKLMRVKSYQKFYAVASAKPPELLESEIAAVKFVTCNVWQAAIPPEEIPKVIINGSRNAKLSLNSNADLDSTKQEGGKLRTASILIHKILPVEILSLETGERTGEWITMADIESGKCSPAEALFQYAFAVMLEAFEADVPDPRLFTVRAISVAIQGKYRIATAANFLHTAVLQPFAQVLKAGYSRLSSTSASMLKGNHAWEFIKRIRPYMVQNTTTKDRPIRKDRYFFCSDWKMATDLMNRLSCSAMIEETGKFFGVPSKYLRICTWAIGHPRIVQIPDGIGDLPNEFVSMNGVLQGDPLTKNILQLSHCIARYMAQYQLVLLAEKSVIDRIPATKQEVPESVKWKEVDTSAQKRREQSNSLFGRPKVAISTGGWEAKTKVKPTPPAQRYGCVPVKFDFLRFRARGENWAEVKDKHIREYLTTVFVDEPEMFLAKQSTSDPRSAMKAMSGLLKAFKADD